MSILEKKIEFYPFYHLYKNPIVFEFTNQLNQLKQSEEQNEQIQEEQIEQPPEQAQEEQIEEAQEKQEYEEYVILNVQFPSSLPTFEKPSYNGIYTITQNPNVTFLSNVSNPSNDPDLILTHISGMFDIKKKDDTTWQLIDNKKDLTIMTCKIENGNTLTDCWIAQNSSHYNQFVKDESLTNIITIHQDPFKSFDIKNQSECISLLYGNFNTDTKKYVYTDYSRIVIKEYIPWKESHLQEQETNLKIFSSLIDRMVFQIAKLKKHYYFHA